MASGTKRSGLGRGLDALLSSTETAETAPSGSGASTEVALDAIQPNPYQPRKNFDAGELDELAASIRRHGLIQPLLVMREGDGWRLIAGERRWRAAQLAGLARVPVVVRQATAQEMLAIAIIENVQRSNLGALESAQAYRQLVDEFALTQAEVADLVGKSRAAVANTLRLLGLADDVRTLLADGHLTEGHARALLALSDPEAQSAAARRAVADGWTVRRTEAEVRRIAALLGAASPGEGEAPAPVDRGMDPDSAAAARRLEESLGTRVEIRRRGAGGQIVVHFYGEDELGTLFDRLVGDAGRR